MAKKTLATEGIASGANTIDSETYYDYIRGLARKVFPNPEQWEFNADTIVSLNTDEYHSFDFSSSKSKQ